MERRPANSYLIGYVALFGSHASYAAGMATKQIGRPPRYDETQVHRALTEVALAGGNCAEASRRLKRQDDPLSVPQSTLKLWRGRQHAVTYEKIRTDVQDRLRGILAAQAEDNARQAGELERDLMGRMSKLVASGEPADLATFAKAVREMATTAGISTDKALVLRGQPSAITEHRTSKELLDSLQRRFPAGVTDSDAEEITDAELVDPPTLAA